jgi:hypothetical protein
MILTSFFVKIWVSSIHGSLGFLRTLKGNELYFSYLLLYLLSADLCTFKPVVLLLIKWNPLIKVVIQWKLTNRHKFGMNKIQLFLPAVQICELTVHLEISITCCAVAAYAII